MLERGQNSTEEKSFAEALGRYISKTLHAQIHIRPFKDTGMLPSFLAQSYSFFEAEISAQRCIFIRAGEKIETPMNIAKHVGLVHSSMEGIVIFTTLSLSAHNRARLITQAVPFVVPGNQLYIPQLAMDLREHFRATKARHHEGLSPAAQAVLLDHLLHHEVYPETPSVLAKRLHYSAMSIGRAFDDLAALGLAIAEKHGREKHLHFPDGPRLLLENAGSLLRSPVRRVRFVRGARPLPQLKLSGESALAKLTNLNPPEIETYAILANDWKATARDHKLFNTDAFEADFAVETWAYDPAGLSDGALVDPLSLYAQFHDHSDERLAIAAGQLLEGMNW